MSGAVFVVLRFDGFNCGASEELDSVWSSAELAIQRIEIVKSGGDHARAIEVIVDVEPDAQ